MCHIVGKDTTFTWLCYFKPKYIILSLNQWSIYLNGCATSWVRSGHCLSAQKRAFLLVWTFKMTGSICSWPVQTRHLSWRQVTLPRWTKCQLEPVKFQIYVWETLWTSILSSQKLFQVGYNFEDQGTAGHCNMSALFLTIWLVYGICWHGSM